MSSLPPRTVRLLLWGAILVGFAAHASHWFLPVDDAFITYRHVDNLLSGHGLVFNPGEPVEGYSNLLWALLLAALGGAGLPLEIAGSLLAAGCGALALGAVYRASALVGLQGHWRFVPAIWLAAAAPWAYWSGAGLETTGFGLALVLLWWGYHRGAPPALLLGGVALLEWTRPEAIAAAPVLALGLAFDRRVGTRKLAPGLAIFAALYGGRLLWRHGTYGAWVATPTAAKSVAGGSRAGEGLQYILEGLSEDRLWFLVVLAMAGFVIAGRRAGRAGTLAGDPGPDPAASPTARLPLTPVATLAIGLLGYGLFVVQVGGDGLYRHRLLAHGLPLLCLLAGAALGGTTVGSARHRGLWAAVVASALAWPAGADEPFYKGYAHANVAEVEESWSTLGETLAELAPPDLVFATTAAGRAPYHAGLRTIDLLGLCDPEIARVHAVADGPISPPAGHERADPEGVLRRRPDLIFVSMLDALGPDRLVLPSEARHTLLTSGLTGYAPWFTNPDFLAAYRPAFLLSADSRDAFSVLVLRGGRAEAIDRARLRAYEWR